MGSSTHLLAKRAFISVILALACAYQLIVDVNRDSDDVPIMRAFRRVALKAHPDKGGKKGDMQKLTAAKEKWETARATTTQGKKPKEEATCGTVEALPGKEGYRIHAEGVLLTYQGFEDQAQWDRFLDFVRSNIKAFSIKHWCATLEESKCGKLHTHLQLQFTKKVDRLSRGFAFEGIAPNASPHDLLGEGMCKRRLQQSMDRAFFYVWADKEGTQRDATGKPCVEGSYEPAWTSARNRYQVLGKWPENLWKQYKLSNECYETYLFACRDGCVARKRNLDAAKEEQAARAEREEMDAVVKRVRRNFQPFAQVPVAQEWLEGFRVERDRYAFLVVLGPSRSGKTEWAKSLFKNPLELKIGPLEHFPDAMRAFCRQTHDGIVLDDVRDLKFLVRFQDKLQGKYDARVEFAATPGGTCSYSRWLWKVPVVITANFTTLNRDLLDSDDFLGNPENRVRVDFPPAPAATGL